MTNQSSQSLLEREDRQRDLVFAECRAAGGIDGLDAGRRDRISGRSERQLVDDHAAQGFANDVNALPET